MPTDQAVITQHQFTIGGQTPELHCHRRQHRPQRRGWQNPKPLFFYVAYTLDGMNSLADRPPNLFRSMVAPAPLPSGSIWEYSDHAGCLMDDVGNPLPPPYKLVNNEYSLLDVTDLVFIDPVTTGYSRAVSGVKSRSNITTSTPTSNRSASSFASTPRATSAGGSAKFPGWRELRYNPGRRPGRPIFRDRHGMYLNGLMLVSSILNFQTARFTTGNDLPFITFLPTYTATAWYHNQLEDDLQGRPSKKR